MEYGGYEYEFELFEGGKHGVGSRDADVMERGLRFIWKDWKTKPVGIRHLPERVADIVTADSTWIKKSIQIDEDEPATAYSPYGIYNLKDAKKKRCGTKIYLHTDDEVKCMAEVNFIVTGLALSCDKSLLYVCSPEKRFVYAFRIAQDGSLHDMYPFARLHIADNPEYIGAVSICVDEHDRLYAATSLGLQTFSWEGHCNCILPLPGKPFAICFAFDKPDQLCLFDTCRQCFKRKVLTRAPKNDAASTPGTPLF